MALKDKNRNWEPQNARNFRNYQKNPNAVTGALFRQSEGKGLTDAQRNKLRKMVGGNRMTTAEYKKGDPNVMSSEDEALLRQATAKYHQKMKAKKNGPIGKMKAAMRGVGDGTPETRRPTGPRNERPNRPQSYRPRPARDTKDYRPEEHGPKRGYGRPGWEGKASKRDKRGFKATWPGKNRGL